MSDRQRFLNKVVIVTGAAQGIGRGVALKWLMKVRKLF
jgi:dihydroxycyclohexadiene carboxylate dehydrogenase